MKVVLFCGGLGTRLREHSETIPKPLVPIGKRPIIWHLMKYYAHHGHKDFILCLGYKGEMIKQYFLNYDPWVSTDLLMSDGGRKIEPSVSDINDWTIRFVETGLHSNIGERLMAVSEFVRDEEVFLANYSDQLSDLPLPDYLDDFHASGALAGFVGVRPSQSFHSVRFGEDHIVQRIAPVAKSDVWINGGFLALNTKIFDYMEPGDELVEAPFQRLIKERRLFAWRYEGFWAAMDTFKDKIDYDRMHGQGVTPWRVWMNN